MTHSESRALTTPPVTIKVEGMSFTADHADDEPRVLDVEIGERVGLCRARDVRATIKKAIADALLKEGEDYRCILQTTVKNSNDIHHRGRGPRIRRGRPTEAEYWLTESGALKVITRLNTPTAQAIVGDMVRVYREALRRIREPAHRVQTLEGVTHWLALQADASRHNDIRRIGDIDALAAEFRQRCAAAADVQTMRLGRRVTARKVAGAIRAYFRVSSHLDVRLSAAAELRRLLDALTMGTVLVKVAGRQPAANARQLGLFVR